MRGCAGWPVCEFIPKRCEVSQHVVKWNVSMSQNHLPPPPNAHTHSTHTHALMHATHVRTKVIIVSELFYRFLYGVVRWYSGPDLTSLGLAPKQKSERSLHTIVAAPKCMFTSTQVTFWAQCSSNKSIFIKLNPKLLNVFALFYCFDLHQNVVSL